MTPDTAREDLAFLRGLVQPDEHWRRGFGQSYAAAGGCYGGQMVLHGLQGLGVIPTTPLLSLMVGAGPSVVFVVLLIFILRRNSLRPAGGGVTSRAVGAVFSAVGIANLFLIAIFASASLREHNFKIWLLYPCVVLVLQGAAWMVAWTLRRQAWLAVVAVGWFLTGLAMGLAIENLGWFILLGGVGFFAFMLVPGLVMMRHSRPAH
jgi:hypothetical protein